MIVSVSRRTDVPAFFSEWFFNRLREGFVFTRNPMNPHQVRRIELTPDKVDCFVFWTKDPTNMLDRLDLLAQYNFYFQITITPYGREIERYVSPKERIVEAFQALSRQIGKKRTVWRYDPIILTDTLDAEYHAVQFAELARKLSGYTERCIISFITMYRKTERHMKALCGRAISDDEKFELGKRLAEIAYDFGVKIETCSESLDLSSAGIGHARCIDDRLIAEIAGKNITVPKDKNQRPACGCAASVDIGAYNTCKHGCLYCYANFSDKAVSNNILKHDPRSPILLE